VKTSPHIVRIEDLPWEEITHGAAFAFRRRRLGAASGAAKIGCSQYEVPAGKRPFPYHFHHVNEESMLVVEGEGTLRLAGSEHPIRAGDYIAFPPGPEGAHQVVNTGRATLRYFCFSTMEAPEVSEYPDAGKIGVFVGSAPGGPEEKRAITGFYRKGGTVGYWEGED
jgi:uncharacterized cupin superfamily protein